MKNDIEPSNDNIIPSDDFPLIDTELLSLIEKAEEGCVTSQEELYVAFSEGVKAKENYEAASYYLDLAYNTLDDLNDENHLLARYDILWNKVLLEGKFKNKKAMKQAFYEMLDFIRVNIPLENWDFSQFEFMGELIHLRDE